MGKRRPLGAVGRVGEDPRARQRTDVALHRSPARKHRLAAVADNLQERADVGGVAPKPAAGNRPGVKADLGAGAAHHVVLALEVDPKLAAREHEAADPAGHGPERARVVVGTPVRAPARLGRAPVGRKHARSRRQHVVVQAARCVVALIAGGAHADSVGEVAQEPHAYRGDGQEHRAGLGVGVDAGETVGRRQAGERRQVKRKFGGAHLVAVGIHLDHTQSVEAKANWDLE